MDSATRQTVKLGVLVGVVLAVVACQLLECDSSERISVFPEEGHPDDALAHAITETLIHQNSDITLHRLDHDKVFRCGPSYFLATRADNRTLVSLDTELDSHRPTKAVIFDSVGRQLLTVYLAADGKAAGYSLWQHEGYELGAGRFTRLTDYDFDGRFDRMTRVWPERERNEVRVRIGEDWLPARRMENDSRCTVEIDGSTRSAEFRDGEWTVR